MTGDHEDCDGPEEDVFCDCSGEHGECADCIALQAPPRRWTKMQCLPAFLTACSDAELLAVEKAAGDAWAARFAVRYQAAPETGERRAG